MNRLARSILGDLIAGCLSSSIVNWQVLEYLFLMPKQKLAVEPEERPYKTTGVHLPTDLWELLNRVAFERARTKGGRASVSALLVDMIEQHRRELQKELSVGIRHAGQGR